MNTYVKANALETIIHRVIPGSDEWKQIRGKYNTASEAPIIMGCSKNCSRDELIKQKATLTPIEYSDYTLEVVFEKGHRTEASARPLVEAIINDDLYPLTCSTGAFLMTSDGVTDTRTMQMEHKQWNQTIADAVEADGPAGIPPLIYWQIEHQHIALPSLEATLFVMSDGTPDKMITCRYSPVPGRREELIAMWEQFNADKIDYKPVFKTAAPVGIKPQDLPALYADVLGELATRTNVDEFTQQFKSMVAAIDTNLETDQDFATAGVTIKFLDDMRDRLELVRKQALSKAVPLDTLFRALDELDALASATSKTLEGKVKVRKANLKDEIVLKAKKEFEQLQVEASQEFSAHSIRIPAIVVEWYEVVKGMRSYDNMRSAINTELAKSKVKLTEARDRVRGNLTTLLASAPDHLFLFPNKNDLVHSDPEFLKLTIESKIREFQESEAAKETDRKVKLRNRVDAIKAAGNFDDDIAYDVLVATRKRLQITDTSDFQEFSMEADVAKGVAIAALTTRIDALLKIAQDEADERERIAKEKTEQQRQENAKTAQVKSASAPVALILDGESSTGYSLDGATAAGYSRSPAITTRVEDGELPMLDDLDPGVTYAAAKENIMASVDAYEEARVILLGRIACELKDRTELPRSTRRLLLDIQAHMEQAA